MRSYTGGLQTSPGEPGPRDPRVERLLAQTRFSPVHRDWLPERNRWLKERCASLRVSGLGARGAGRVRVLLLNGVLGVSFYPAILDFFDALRAAKPELEVVSASYFDDIYEYGEGVVRRGVRVVKASEVMTWSAEQVNDFDLVIAIGPSDALASLMTLDGLRSRLVMFDPAFYHQLIVSSPEFLRHQAEDPRVVPRYRGARATPPNKLTVYTSQPIAKVTFDLGRFFPVDDFEWHSLPYVPIGFGFTESFRAAEPAFDVALMGRAARDYTLLDPSRLRGVRFLFVGDIDKVGDLAALRSAGDITVLSDLSRDDYAKVISLCRCAVVPLYRASRNVLMSVLDVLSAGVPLVATPSLGFEALRRAGAPVVFPADERPDGELPLGTASRAPERAASEAMTTELLDLLADEPRRKELSARSIAFAREHLDIYRMLDRMLRELGQDDAVARPLTGSGGSGTMTVTRDMNENGTPSSARSSARPAAARRGVAFMAFSTESSDGARVDSNLVEDARGLRRRGVPSVLLQVHLHATDERENARRLDELVDRIVGGRYEWAICPELWTAELGRRLLDAGVQVVERRPRSLEDPSVSLEPLLAGLPAGAPLDEYQGLVEVLGQSTADGFANADLVLGHPCSYQSSISDNPFFAEIAGLPEFAAHKGCAYCFNSNFGRNGQPPVSPAAVLDEVRLRRATLPGLKTVWIAFAEVVFDVLGAAFDRSRGDPVWQGLTVAMQCRPDVVVKRRKDIEELAARAHAAGTVVKIAVVGYENFSPAEIQVLNRGVSPGDLATAAEILGGWQREPVPGLDVRDYIPSFILFTPWTTLEDLELNLREIERHGLMNANVERLRLGRATPLYEMARRQGLTGSEPVRLAVHPNGYFSEAAIRFKDPRVASACDGFDRLKSLGFTDQAPLLAAIVDAVRRSPDPATIDWSAVEATWQRIRQLASESPHRSGPDRPDERASIDVRRVHEVLARNGIAPRVKLSDLPGRAPPARSRRTATEEPVRLSVGSSCNNGCQPCVWARRLAFAPPATLPPPPVAGKKVLLAGREPTLREDLPELVRELRAAGAGRVEIHTNGRRFLYPRFVRALDVAGLDSAVVKLFGPDAAAWDAHTREPGSFAQTIEGMAVLAQVAPGITLTGMIFPGRGAGSRLGEMMAFSRSLGLSRVIAVLRLARQDLLALGDLESQVRAVLGASDGPNVYISVE